MQNESIELWQRVGGGQEPTRVDAPGRGEAGPTRRSGVYMVQFSNCAYASRCSDTWRAIGFMSRYMDSFYLAIVHVQIYMALHRDGIGTNTWTTTRGELS